MLHKATAARPSAQKTAATQIGTDIGALTVEALGQQLRDVLPTRRLHSVSLCDHQANVLWLSEGALGPDEHALVVEALELLSTDTSLPCHERALDDGRLAMFLPVRTPTADLVGIAMILADGKAVGDDTLERMAATPVRAIMLRLAVLLKPAALRTAAAAAAPLELVDETQAAAAAVAVKPMSPVEVNDILEFDLPPNEMPAPRARPSGASASDMMSLEFVDIPVIDERFLEAASAAAAPAPTPAPPAVAASAGEAVELADSATTAEAPAPFAAPAKPVPKAAPPAARRTPAPAAPPAARPEEKAPAPSVAAPAATVMSPAAANDPNLLLEVLPFAKLRAGGQTRRFQVIARMSQVRAIRRRSMRWCCSA